MAKPDDSKQHNSNPRAPGQRSRSLLGQMLGRLGWPSHRSREEHLGPGRGGLWWRLLGSLAVMWWLVASGADALLQRWWLRDAQGNAQGADTSSTWGLDFVAAHARLEVFRWGGTLLGALVCGAWVWRQGRIAVANARESPASLGVLWRAGEAELPTLSGLSTPQTGRWIPLEDKLGLDRFRGAALRACVAGAALLGATLGGRAWPLWLEFWAARPLDVREPWLGQDLSFYLFRLPALDFAWRMLLLAHWMALALSVAIYLFEDSLQLGRRLWASARALRHLAVLLALALAWKSVGTLLYPFELLVRHSPEWSGPHALDWFWRLPLNFASAAASLLCALLCLRASRRNRPSAVLKWSLAPLPLSWLLVNALPALHDASSSRQLIDAQDAPFARAQVSWTRLALGFSEAAPPNTPPNSAQAARSLSEALGSREVALWAQRNAQSSDSSNLGALDAPGGSSTWGSSRMLWQRATTGRFEPRTWEERHLDVSSTLALKRFSIQLSPPPAAPAPSTSPEISVVQATSSAHLQLRDEHQMPLLAGVDETDSPGLLLDSEVAEVMATAEALRQGSEPRAEPSKGGSPQAALPDSFFGNSSSTAQLAALGAGRTLPVFRVLNTSKATAPGRSSEASSEQQAGVAGVGVALDSAWKRWLAAWRFGSLRLARSPRVDEGARLAWRLDVSQRCRSLAPFLSWPDAPRPLLDEQGHLFWMLDGYTLSAAFPLARSLDTASAFASPDLNSTRVPRAQDTAVNQAQQEADSQRRKNLILSVIRRQEILSRLALNLDGFNWARASVVALADASTGSVRLFPLQGRDPILSLYRRALPELWSPAQALPTFARAALRTPPHLACLQASAWASAMNAASRPDNAPAPTVQPHPWRAINFFFIPASQGLRTGVLLQSSPDAGTTRSTSTSSTWAAAISPAWGTPQLNGGPLKTNWQAHLFAPGPRPSLDWNLVDALSPLEADSDPLHWLLRQRSNQLNSTSTTAATRASPTEQAEAHQNWRLARDLWSQELQAQQRGDKSAAQKLQAQLGQILERNAQRTP